MNETRLTLWGVPIDALSKNEALALLPKLGLIFTPNPEILLKARASTAYRKVLQKADLSLPDGHGLQFVTTLEEFPLFLRVLFVLPAYILFLFWKNLFKRVIPELIHGSDFMMDVVAYAHKNKLSVFFLGAAPGVADETAKVFKRKFPGLKVAGASSLDPGDEAYEAVRSSGAEVLFVAYGAPKQEEWIVDYKKKLPGVKLFMAVGGSFDFWSGRLQRAPLPFRTLGLEWLWRLIKEPRRLVRILNALLVFPFTYLFSSKR